MSDNNRIYDEKIDGAAATILHCMTMGGVVLKAKNAPAFGFADSTDAKAPNPMPTG